MGIDKNDLYDPITESRYQRLLDSFKEIAPGTRVLDVACGEGHFVDAAIRAGWDASGIDLSKSAVAICQRFGLPVRNLDFFSSALRAASLDLITMFELIEHVSVPSRFPSRAEELLKPGGLLYLTTPNFASLDRKLLGADWHPVHREHLVYFTPRTLEKLIRTRTSFEILYIRTRNLSIAALRRLVFGTRHEPETTLRTKEQMLRSSIESSGPLRVLKSLLNTGLDSLGWGSAMVALCRKPSQ
jgi:2-polyprenyl-3-methyl-5-hydroxy-6-metoxy-1,4-benzoquinol methylase